MEIIPKSTQPSFSFSTNIFTYLGIIVLIGTVGAFLLFQFVLSPARKETLGEKDQQLAQQKTQEQRDAEQEVLKYQRKVNDFTRLSAEQKTTIPFLEFLEQNVHQQVSLSDGSVDLSTNTMQLAGQAPSFRVVQEQLLVFRSRTDVLRQFEFSDLRAGDGGVAFGLTLVFSNNFGE